MGQYDIARRIARAVRLEDFTHALRGHYFADADGFGIRFRIVHASAHVRIEREIEHAQQQTAGRQGRDGRFLEAEIRGRGLPFGPRGKHDLFGERSGHAGLLMAGRKCSAWAARKRGAQSYRLRAPFAPGNSAPV